MILIDDSGSGSLIGGTIIGIMRTESGEFLYDVIPLEYYSPSLFKKKSYLDKVVDIVSNLFNKLDVRQNENIFVCRGYMFDKLRIWLKNNHYNFTNTKIEEPLQSKIEKTFENYAINLGFPKRYISYTKYPFHFHRILCWVYADYENRVKLCKTGWKSWQKYGNLPINISYQKINKSKYICLKCNRRINDNSYVKIIEFTSIRPQKIYLHSSC
ncbi:hypothetical protein SAMN02745883_00066 [Caminicella sporogenes DSM 14501]|uniref:Uncharacterized protein n=1 Tax=Caminicella sporogenes DSM 14501 TaxID=1121266 RepID=A0A1M6L4G2_9FIRM|nr:hypothetical protein [Caminicella sporogenes]RKD27699.1 hypothetical protein BET04_01135 [Caminicella sporogenes]WIF94724.1 hypothetical protein QNI18_10735 [Caminicella sporogenes]SHJ66004.1 hypothetical protein SAMN02745883_00066 [Caminicella sporogenes DSM 14501]